MEKSEKNRVKKPGPKMLGFILRFIPAYFLVLCFFYVAGPLYGRIFLPLFAYGIELIQPEYEVRSYGLERINKVSQIYYEVKINRPITDKLGVPRYGKEVKVGTVTSLLYIQPIIIFPLLLSWPGLSKRERLKAAMICVPFLIAIALIDFPVLLISRIEKGFALDSASGQIRIFIEHLLSNGGRQVLAVLVFVISVALVRANKFPAVKLDVGRNDPCPCNSGKKYKNCCMK